VLSNQPYKGIKMKNIFDAKPMNFSNKIDLPSAINALACVPENFSEYFERAVQNITFIRLGEKTNQYENFRSVYYIENIDGRISSECFTPLCTDNLTDDCTTDEQVLHFLNTRFSTEKPDSFSYFVQNHYGLRPEILEKDGLVYAKIVKVAELNSCGYQNDNYFNCYHSIQPFGAEKYTWMILNLQFDIIKGFNSKLELVNFLRECHETGI